MYVTKKFLTLVEVTGHIFYLHDFYVKLAHEHMMII